MNDTPEKSGHSYRPLIIAALIAGVAGGGWGFLSLILPAITDDGKTVYIKAEESPFMVAPVTPGGANIPHQDKLVLDAAAGQPTGPVVEQLAPAPEQPVLDRQAAGSNTGPLMAMEPAPQAAVPEAGVTDAPVALGRAVRTVPEEPAQKPAAASGQAADLPPPSQINAAQGPKKVNKDQIVNPGPETRSIEIVKPPEERMVPAASVPSEKPAAVQGMRPPSGEVEIAPPSSPAVGSKDDKADNKASTQPAKKAAASRAKAGGTVRYQLGSYFSRAAAERAIGIFGKKYKAVLSESSLSIVEATISGNKKVFRVQGRAANKLEAQAICGRVKARGGACVVFR